MPLSPPLSLSPTALDRRQFLKNLALSASLLSVASVATDALAQTLAAVARNRVIPDFSEQNILRFTAGLRPYRKEGPRLERESRFGKTVVHNYGHGGGGITMSWGSAQEAADLIAGDIRKDEPLAVLGGGVIGLSTAHELRERGYRKVTLYAENWHPKITSSFAGGQWSPALAGNFSDQARYDRILEASFRKFAHFKGPKYGVHMADNLIAQGSQDQLIKIKIPSLPAPVPLARLPFAGLDVGGALCRSWMVEPPIYLPALMWRLSQAGVGFFTKSFRMTDNEGQSSSDVENLKERVVFNCLGLGAKKLVVDDELIPVRGRLVHLRPDARVDYLLLQEGGYLFSRRDAIVLGGTYDEGESDLSFDPRQYEGILKSHREFFKVAVQGEDERLSRADIPYWTVDALSARA